MKPQLVIGLGNPLAGDDGVGWHVAERLSRDPRLPPTTEVVQAGTDLLRLADRLAGRRRLVLVDALLESGPSGRVVRLEGDLRQIEDRRPYSAHALSPLDALRLLRDHVPGVRDVPVAFVGVTITEVRTRPGLSPSLLERLDLVVDAVLLALQEIPAP